MGKELEEGYVIDLHGDEQHEDECVELHDGQICHMDEAIMNESDGKYYHTDDDGLQWCETNECYYDDSDMIFGELYNGGEGWFHQDSDYCYSEHSDRYFQCTDTANNCGFYYVESRDDYLPEDEVDENENWDNTFTIKDTMFTKTFGMPYTFGVEMETCNGYLEYTSKYSLKCVDDGSIEAQEYVTGVLQGNKGMKELENICQAVNRVCYVDRTCGVHVHIGGANFNRRFAILSIMLGQMMQTQLFKIQPKSRRTNTYCKEIPEKYYQLRTVNKKEFPFTHKRMLRLLSEYIANSTDGFGKANCKKSSNPGGHYSSTRYKWLNLNNFSYRDRGDTIEFRQHSGSLDYNKIRKWVLFCMSFVSFVENHSRTIIETFNRFQEDPAVCISMREVLVAGLGKEGDVVADYYDKREERFN